MNELNDIYKNEARKYILKLINFFGSIKIEKCLEKYKKSLVYSGPIFGRYHLKYRHPWWHSLLYFYELESKGKSINKNLDIRLKLLAMDGKKLSTLQKMMPESIKYKFRKDLLDDERASDFLFELDLAWHYLAMGYELSWYEESNCPDFLVKTKDFDFNVECKRVTVDGSRKIRRRDFYRLVEMVLPRVEELNYIGKIDVELNDRLHSSNQHLESLSNQIIKAIQNFGIKGSFKFPLGNVAFSLKKSDGKIVNFKELHQEMLNRKPHEAQGVLFASARNHMPINPIEFTLKSKKSDKVLLGIKEKIKNAAIKQLPADKPGVVSCFLEDIFDLTSLASNSGLQLMSSYLLDKIELSHIAAISFSSEGRVQRHPEFENYNSQGLLFRNENCIYKEVREFQFLSKENATV